MLKSKNVIATIAVKDLAAAKGFYEGKLGFVPADGDGVHYVSYKSGDSNLLVYQSEFAGGYKATVATWAVGDEVTAVAAELKAKGVPFLRYPDLPETRLEGDVHVAGQMKTAWCSDPDGNILCLVSA